jgi:hypothetical protein
MTCESALRATACYRGEPAVGTVRRPVRSPLVFDGRNIYNREHMKTDGFNDFSIRGGACGKTKPALEALMNGGEARPQAFQERPS